MLRKPCTTTGPFWPLPSKLRNPLGRVNVGRNVTERNVNEGQVVTVPVPQDEREDRRDGGAGVRAGAGAVRGALRRRQGSVVTTVSCVLEDDIALVI